jgi:YjbE family integral membrane protein
MTGVSEIDFWLPLGKIVWVNILLSGDNALVIALVCHALPENRRKWGLVLGAAPAVILLIAFTAVALYLLAVPYLKLAGGLLLLWVASDLLRQEEEEVVEHQHVEYSLWRAAWTIIVADTVMSLDNVIAVAGAANGRLGLMALGLSISVPLVIFGAGILLLILEKLPILVVAGAGLLGWIAGGLVSGDRALAPWIEANFPLLDTALPIAFTAGAIGLGYLLAWFDQRRATVAN